MSTKKSATKKKHVAVFSSNDNDKMRNFNGCFSSGPNCICNKRFVQLHMMGLHMMGLHKNWSSF